MVVSSADEENRPQPVHASGRYKLRDIWEDISREFRDSAHGDRGDREKEQNKSRIKTPM